MITIRKTRRPALRLVGAAIAYATVVVDVQGCATGARSGESVQPRAAPYAVVTVVNHTPGVMLIYLRAGAAAVPLGTVPGQGSRAFPAPEGFGGGATEFWIEARERGREERGYSSHTFRLDRGRVASWTLYPTSSTAVTVR